MSVIIGIIENNSYNDLREKRTLDILPQKNNPPFGNDCFKKKKEVM